MATSVGNVIFSISADLKNIQGRLRELEGNFNTSFGRIEGLAKNFGKGILQGLAAGFSIGALTGFTKEVLNLADSLQNLSDQTGLSVELLSGIKSPLEEAGSSMDAFAKGVFNLQKNLGNVDKDSDKVAQSIKRLGLNLTDLRNSSPDEFIRKVTDALAKIENPVERNTILFNLLGKSAKELGPAFEQLVGRFQELKANGLTASDVKALDDVGDALTRLKNQALVLGAEGVAAILRFYGVLRDTPKVGLQLDAATTAAARVFNLPKERVEGMTSKEIIAQAEQGPEPLRRSARIARDELLNLREEFNKLNSVNVAKPQAVFKGISDGAKKSKKDVDNLVDSFLDGLSKQLENINNKKIELQFGEAGGLAASLDAQLERFKDNLRDKQLPIPKGLEEFFKSLKDRILLANDELRRMQHEMQKLDDLGKAFSQDSAEFLNVDEDLARVSEERKRLTKDLEEMRQELKLGAMDTSTPEAANRQRIASIEVEFVRTANRITELGRAAGATQEQIAEDIALAWQKALQDIGRHVDESAAQWADAFEGTSLAILDALNEIGTGRSIKDIFMNLGQRISDALTQALVTKPIEKWIKDQADKIATGGFGLEDIFGNIFGGGKQQQVQSGVLGKLGEQNLGGEVAIAAIEAQAATAQTSMSALSAEAQASLQLSSSTAQTGIQTTGTTAQAGIEAVKVAAIAAIQAASAQQSSAPGGSIPFLDIFGGEAAGGADIFAGGGADFASQGAGGIGSALMLHTGGAIGDGGKRVVLELPRYHGGGGLKADERLIVGQTGEHMMNRLAVAGVGRHALDFMNTTGRMPSTGDSGASNTNQFNITINSPDADSFRRSRSQWESDIAKVVARGQKRN